MTLSFGVIKTMSVRPHFASLFAFFLSLFGTCSASHAGQSSAASPVASLKTIVVSAQSSSDSVITVPPATMVTLSLRNQKSPTPNEKVDLQSWLSKQEALNGLESTDLKPWHIVVTYDQFDEDGDKVHSGVFEEYWLNPNQYRRGYKADNLNQTDYATERGLFRQGDQKWPDRAQLQVRSEIVAPFSYAASLVDVHATNLERTFGKNRLQCTLIERNSAISDPTQFCFESGTSILRYARGQFWFQTAYNQIVLFQGRNIAQEVTVTDGGKRYLELHVTKLELLPSGSDSTVAPPPGTPGPIGDRISGVVLVPIKMLGPKYPASLRGQHFRVDVEFVMGKDGHVISAHAVSGPPEAQKPCEDAVLQWLFQPYLVAGNPVEVESKTACQYN